MTIMENQLQKQHDAKQGMNNKDEPPSQHLNSSPHSIILPIHMANLPLNILEQLQQHQSTLQPQSQAQVQTQKPQEDKSKATTADERRQRRLLRNRLAAKDCRRKKKEYIKQMQDSISRLESDQVNLKNELAELKDKIASPPLPLPLQQINNNDYKLMMKQVEELNAKLGNTK